MDVFARSGSNEWIILCCLVFVYPQGSAGSDEDHIFSPWQLEPLVETAQVNTEGWLCVGKAGMELMWQLCSTWTLANSLIYLTVNYRSLSDSESSSTIYVFVSYKSWPWNYQTWLGKVMVPTGKQTLTILTIKSNCKALQCVGKRWDAIQHGAKGWAWVSHRLVGDKDL